MGHDIVIGDNVARAYISYNWSCMREFFHISDITGETGAYAAIRIREALKELAELGYVPRNDMRVDGWGVWTVDVDMEPGKTIVWLNESVRGCPSGVFQGLDENGRCIIMPDQRVFEAVMPSPPAISLKRNKFTVQPDFSSPGHHCMFCYILQHLLELAEQYPEEVWNSD